MKRETVGKLSQDLLLKTPETRDPIELEREMHKDYEKNIIECIDRGKKEMNGDFYVVVETKKEPKMPNVMRNYFFFRKSCPTPNYDQTLYRYHTSSDSIDFIWVIPSQDSCFMLRDNALLVPPEEKLLLDYVLAFSDGTLFKLCKKLNGEKDDSPLLEI